MDNINILNQLSAILLTLSISIIFVIIGLVYSKKYQGLNNYLVASRSVGTFSLTTSLVASALGAWILFGPASAATWGGIGAVVGYSLENIQQQPLFLPMLPLMQDQIISMLLMQMQLNWLLKKKYLLIYLQLNNC